MKIESKFIENLKTRLKIKEVVGQYVTLTKAGVNYKGYLPFS